MSLPIEDYALIGDCLTAALIGCDGSIDWLCWPAFDSDACFAALLGTSKNGCWKLSPATRTERVSRKYKSDTLILETTFVTKTGEVTLIEFMPPRGAVSDIVRLVRGDRGTVKMAMELILRFGSGSNVPWVRRVDDQTLQAISGPDMVVLRTPIQTRGKDMTTIANFEIEAGQTIPFVLTYEASHHLVPRPIDVEQALRDTQNFWREWSSRSTYRGQYSDIVQRSLITLKALTYAPTGGIVAAPTTSLPETLGGSRNWDYRYCWLRDSTFTLLALSTSGYLTEAGDWHNWLLRAAAGAPSEMQIMYSITGQRRLIEWEAAWLSGYQGAKPVRFGNAAHAQLQLDTYGELMDAFHQARMAGVELAEDTWGLEIALLSHLAKIWNTPDHGIWERRGSPKHYVFSKVMTWVAFDRGIKTAEHFKFEAPHSQWRDLREQIHRDICANGFNEELDSFVESYGSNLLDASLLLIPAVGFLNSHDPRVRGTINAVERHLVQNGFVMRHDPRESSSDETQPLEGAFLACTLWLADAYVLRGEIDKAHELFNRVTNVANDVGLLSEEYDARAQRLVGNFPQALTHIALINTAHNIHSALTPASKPAVKRAKQNN